MIATAARVAVPRLWPGETVVILGGGSSLTQADVDFCRGKARVIAIKEAGLFRAPWAEVLYAADAKWWRYYTMAEDFVGRKYAIEQDPSQPPTDWSQWPYVDVLRNTGTEGLELDPTGLRTGFNSGYQAVNLAYHLAGPTTVVLLGFDMWGGPNGPNWFDSPGLHTPSPYPLFLQAFRTIAEPLKSEGVHVVNASRFTVMDAFERVPLEECFT